MASSDKNASSLKVKK